VGAVVDADGVKFPKDVLAEQTVELGAEQTIQLTQIHDRDRMPYPPMIGEPEVQLHGNGVTHDSGAFRVALGGVQRKVPGMVRLGADDRLHAAGVHQQGNRIAIDFGFDENHGL